MREEAVTGEDARAKRARPRARGRGARGPLTSSSSPEARFIPKMPVKKEQRLMAAVITVKVTSSLSSPLRWDESL